MSLEELPPFLNHRDAAVRLEAVKILAGLTASDETLPMVRNLNVTAPLCRLVSDENKTVAQLTLQALVNMSQDPHQQCVTDMMNASIVDVCMELLRDSSFQWIELVIMLLANVTRIDKAAKQLIQEDDAKLCSLHVKRLMVWFAKQPSDPRYDYIAYIIVNISNVEAGRKLFMENNCKLIKSIMPQLIWSIEQSTGDEMRNESLFLFLRNLFMDKSHISALLDDNLGLYELLLLPLAGQGRFDPEDIDPMPKKVQNALKDPGTRRVRSLRIRTAILEILSICGQIKIHRQMLRRSNVYYLIRELHEEEKEKGVTEHDDIIIDLVHILKLDDDEGDEQVKIEEVEEVTPEDLKELEEDLDEVE